jgi:hypothetical protein
MCTAQHHTQLMNALLLATGCADDLEIKSEACMLNIQQQELGDCMPEVMNHYHQDVLLYKMCWAYCLKVLQAGDVQQGGLV